MSDIAFMPATELVRLMAGKRLSPVEVADAVLGRIESVNGRLNALIHHDPDQVRQAARRAEAEVMRGDDLGPLHGVPFTTKDTTPVRGAPLTFGMAPFAGHIADTTAPVVQRLERAGAIFLGVTNMPELAYRAMTDNHLYGPTRNPWHPGMNAGGSSGGAAAAVAVGLGPLAEGNDAAGSIRIPASCCGVVGLKPSAGRVPFVSQGTGSFAVGTSEGPLTRTVADAALMLQVMAGPDDRDPLSLPNSGTDYPAAIDQDITGWRIAWSPDLGIADVDPEIATLTTSALDAFSELGCQVEQAQPDLGDPLQTFQNTWLPRLRMVEQMFGAWRSWQGRVDDQLLELLEMAVGLDPAAVTQAEIDRGRMWAGLCSFFDRYDILITPTIAVPAPQNSTFTPHRLTGRPLVEQLIGWTLTYPFNLAGVLPAASVPCGFTRTGTPVGLQIVGRRHADAAVLTASAAFERARPWAHRRPVYRPVESAQDTDSKRET